MYIENEMYIKFLIFMHLQFFNITYRNIRICKLHVVVIFTVNSKFGKEYAMLNKRFLPTFMSSNQLSYWGCLIKACYLLNEASGHSLLSFTDPHQRAG